MLPTGWAGGCSGLVLGGIKTGEGVETTAGEGGKNWFSASGGGLTGSGVKKTGGVKKTVRGGKKTRGPKHSRAHAQTISAEYTCMHIKMGQHPRLRSTSTSSNKMNAELRQHCSSVNSVTCAHHGTLRNGLTFTLQLASRCRKGFTALSDAERWQLYTLHKHGK